MLNDIFKPLKDKIKVLTGIEDVQWFNMQYEALGWVYSAGCFIEFPNPLDFGPMSKQARRTPVRIRIHCYTKVVNTHDGVTDSDVVTHEALAVACRDELQGFNPGSLLQRPLQFVGWQHWHKWKGWMVTFVDFEGSLII